MKEMRKCTFTIGVTLTIFLIGCGPKVNTTKTTGTNLSKYETFAYLPNSNFDDSETGYTDETVGKSVIESVNRNLMKFGYGLDRDNPDLLVLITTMVDREVYTDREPVYATYPNYYGSVYTVSPYYEPFYYYGYNNYTQLVGYETDRETYKEGTLEVRLVDSKTKETVWKGTASDAIIRQNDSAAIAEFVDNMFSKYPINKTVSR